MKIATTIFALIEVLVLHQVSSLHFEYPNFSNQKSDLSNLKIVTQDWYTQGPNAAFQDSELWLTQLDNVSEDTSNLGRVIYTEPIDLSTIAYFQTSFTFKITTTKPYSYSGAGMAFFISSSIQASLNSTSRGAIGLVNPYSSVNPNFFAVEFDTGQSTNFVDPSSSHIGIDINSMISLAIADSSPGAPFYPELFLFNNYSFTAWIEYNCSSSCIIQVWMSNNTASINRPAQPCMKLIHDLSTVLNGPAYLGFSATSAPLTLGPEAHTIFSWNFSSVSKTDDRSCWTCHRRNVILLSVVILGFVMVVSLISGFLIYFSHSKTRRSRTPPNDANIQGALKAVPRFSLSELKKATQGFSNRFKIGEGGFSIVYKGTLSDGSLIAIKKLKEGVRKETEFCREIGIISKIRHRNLLELQGWCYERGEAMLLYQHMSNGSLDKHLFGKSRECLDRDTRFSIIVGIGAALEYLHDGLGDCVLHRDIKAANVLLTDGFQPKLSDFGLARLISHDRAVTMTNAGTPGYVAPELVYAHRATDKVDVYSFGVVALEVACGRKVMENEELLIDLVWELIQNGHDIIEALDPIIRINMSSHDEHQWRCVLHVALLCYSPIPDERPPMRQVTQVLKDGMLMPLPAIRPLYPFTNIKWHDSTKRSSTKVAFSASNSVITPR